MTQSPAWYEFRIVSHIDKAWADWLGNCQMEYTDDGHTILTIYIADQATLHGILSRLRDMRLTILSMHIIPNED